MEERIFENEREERITEPLAAATDSIVRFFDASGRTVRDPADEDGFTAMETARLMWLCVQAQAC